MVKIKTLELTFMFYVIEDIIKTYFHVETNKNSQGEITFVFSIIIQYLPKKENISIIVIQSYFIFMSRLIPKLGFDLNRPLFPTYFPSLVYVGISTNL